MYCPVVLGIYYFYADITDFFHYHDKGCLFCRCFDTAGDNTL